MTVKTLLDRMPTEKAAAIRKIILAARKLRAQGKRVSPEEQRRRKNLAQRERRAAKKAAAQFDEQLQELDSDADTV